MDLFVAMSIIDCENARIMMMCIRYVKYSYSKIKSTRVKKTHSKKFQEYKASSSFCCGRHSSSYYPEMMCCSYSNSALTLGYLICKPLVSHPLVVVISTLEYMLPPSYVIDKSNASVCTSTSHSLLLESTTTTPPKTS